MPRPWLRRLRTWAIRGGLVLAVLVLAGLGWAGCEQYAGQSNLNVIRAELDRTDPGWRMHDLHRLRSESLPPDPENPVVHLIAAKARLRAFRDWSRRTSQSDEPSYNWLPEVELNRRPRPLAEADARCTRDEDRDALDAVREVRRLTRPGGVARQIGDDPFSMLMPDVQEMREGASAMQLDAVVAALDGDPDRAAESVLAGMAIARGMGDPPTLIDMLVRIAIAQVALGTAERVLALTEPGEARLAEWQAAFQAEADTDRLRPALRGERAGLDLFMTNIANGKLPVGTAVGMMGGGGGLLDNLAVRVYKAQYLAADHAFMLQLFNKWIEATRQPHHQRPDFENEVPKPPSFRHLFSRLLLPAMQKCAAAEARSTAALRCGAAGVACERFRKKHGRWPETLSEVNEFLPAVPKDPYDGGPLRYARFPGGVVVYAVGLDKADNGGNISWRGEPGTDYGFRMWDPDRRSADPLPDPDPDPSGN